MTDTQYDRAPGDASALPDVEQGTSSGVLVYTIGLALAVVLTAMSFWVANTSLLWAGGVSLGLTVLAIAQMGIHLVFFLHVTTGPDNTNNVMALAFGVLIVAPGRRRIASDHGRSERQHDACGRADESANAALRSVAGMPAANRACLPCAARFRGYWWPDRSGGGCDRRT